MQGFTQRQWHPGTHPPPPGFEKKKLWHNCSLVCTVSVLLSDVELLAVSVWSHPHVGRHAFASQFDGQNSSLDKCGFEDRRMAGEREASMHIKTISMGAAKPGKSWRSTYMATLDINFGATGVKTSKQSIKVNICDLVRQPFFVAVRN